MKVRVYGILVALIIITGVMLGIVTLKQNIFAKNEDVLSADKEGITLKGDLEDGKSLSVNIYDSMSPEYQAANTYISAKEGIKAMNLYDISVLDSSSKEVKLSNKALLEFNENVCMPNVEGATYALYYESADGIYAKLDSYQAEGTICSNVKTLKKIVLVATSGSVVNAAPQVEVPATPAITEEPMDSMMYAMENVNIRKSPDANSDKVGSLIGGGKVRVIAKVKTPDREWYKISLEDGTVGYVISEMLSANEIVQQSLSQTTASASSRNSRTNSSSSSSRSNSNNDTYNDNSSNYQQPETNYSEQQQSQQETTPQIEPTPTPQPQPEPTPTPAPEPGE